MDWNLGMRRRHELDVLVASIPKRFRTRPDRLPNIDKCIEEIRDARAKLWNEKNPPRPEPSADWMDGPGTGPKPKRKLKPAGTVNSVFDDFPPLDS
ncbi:MAG: hypothetical protein QNJ09_18440 [Paracoccaceae bacterium]|nr:hypothetical protein [Paracoccaceae bacterium]